MNVIFGEIDNGPGGMTWGLEMEGTWGWIREYDDYPEMWKDAVLLGKLGHKVKFYTQEEYNLDVALLTELENDD